MTQTRCSDSGSMSEDEGKIKPKQSAFALLMDDDDGTDGSDANSEADAEEEVAKPMAKEKSKKVNTYLKVPARRVYNKRKPDPGAVKKLLLFPEASLDAQSGLT